MAKSRRRKISYERRRGCRLVTSHVPGNNGYPYITVGPNKRITIARYVYAKRYGEIPPGKVIRHTCDNKRCIELSHLLLGTNLDNVRDAMERGLNPKHERHGMAKLTAAEVSIIRQLLEAGYSGAKVADFFGLHKTTVSRIGTGRSWY